MEKKMGSTQVNIEALMGARKTGIAGVVGTENIILPGIVKGYAVMGGGDDHDHPLDGPHPTDGSNAYSLGAMLYQIGKDRPAPGDEHPLDGPFPTDYKR